MVTGSGLQSITENVTKGVILCEEPIWGYNVFVVKILGYVLMILSLAAVVLNVLALIVIFRAPKLKPVMRIFMFSLILCHLLMGLIVMPFRIIGMIANFLETSEPVYCNIFNSIEKMLYINSICHLCVLTFERYISLCRPFKYGNLFKRRSGMCFLFACWLISSGLAFGIIPNQLHMEGVQKEIQCIVELTRNCHSLLNVPYAFAAAVLCYIFPAGFILICNFFILIAVEKRRKLFLRLIHINTERGSLYRRHFGTKLAQTLMYMTSCFIVCWLPFFVVQSVNPLIMFQVPKYVWIFTNWLGYAYSVMNPFLYLKSISFLRFRFMNKIL